VATKLPIRDLDTEAISAKVRGSQPKWEPNYLFCWVNLPYQLAILGLSAQSNN